MADIKTYSQPAFSVSIYIAGDIELVRLACQEFCDDVGLCVTVIPADFIYTGGNLPPGAKVGLVNYPRFPKTPQEILEIAKDLAKKLIISCDQQTALIDSNHNTLWLTRNGITPEK